MENKIKEFKKFVEKQLVDFDDNRETPIEIYANDIVEKAVKLFAIPVVIKSFCVCKHGFKKKNSDECAICGGKWKGRPKQTVL